MAALLQLLHLKHQANPKVEMLQRIYLFASCSERELRFLATRADAVQAPTGKVLTVEGRPPDTFYMLLEGVVRVTTAGEADVQYGPGAAFDVVAMAERSPARATITAEGPVRMLVMSHAQFRAVAPLPRLQDALWHVTSPAGVAPPLQPRHPDLAPVQRPARKWRPLCIDSAGADQVPTPAFAGRQATPLRSFEDSVGASFPAPEEDS